MATSSISEMELVLRSRIYSFPYQEHIKHLLGLLHCSWFPSQKKDRMPAENLTARTAASSLHAHLITVRSITGISISDPKRGRKDRGRQVIPSATLLKVAGVRFRKTHEGDNNWLFDISFDKGTIWILTIVINGDTESILRNLVAYEQGYNDISSKLVTDYIGYIDCLINTGEDVELICCRGIIANRLGDHDVVATMFNRLRDSLLISKDEFYYTQMFIKVSNQYRKTWRRWKANLRENYFNTPWAFISFLADVFLLTLTVIQTGFTVILLSLIISKYYKALFQMMRHAGVTRGNNIVVILPWVCSPLQNLR